jgi:hypothetical protein
MSFSVETYELHVRVVEGRNLRNVLVRRLPRRLLTWCLAAMVWLHGAGQVVVRPTDALAARNPGLTRRARSALGDCNVASVCAVESVARGNT